MTEQAYEAGTDTLPHALEAVFGAPANLLDRTQEQWGSARSEVVECRLPAGQVSRLYCKHENGDGAVNPAFGHRGGLARETLVYERLLDRPEVSSPRYHGSYLDQPTGERWLILEYHDAPRLHRTTDPGQAIELAASWAGRFHATFDESLSEAARFLPRYDSAYFAGWARRTAAYAGALHQEFPWLRRACRRFEELADRLLVARPTVVHGEFYPLNVLVVDGKIRPVDWESAAIAPGEIDLAALTERWAPELAARAERAYVRSRWPGGPPQVFEATLAAARIYLYLRWLGDSRQATLDERSRWRFDDLHALCERVELL